MVIIGHWFSPFKTFRILGHLLCCLFKSVQCVHQPKSVQGITQIGFSMSISLSCSVLIGLFQSIMFHLLHPDQVNFVSQSLSVQSFLPVQTQALSVLFCLVMLVLPIRPSGCGRLFRFFMFLSLFAIAICLSYSLYVRRTLLHPLVSIVGLLFYSNF